MKKNKLAVLPICLIALALFSCKGKDSYTIDGTIPNKSYDNQMVYFQRMDMTPYGNSKPILLDSTTIKNGKFVFSGKASKDPYMAFVSIKQKLANEISNQNKNDNDPIGIVVVEAGKIKLTIDSSSVIMEGTPRNDTFRKLTSLMKDMVTTDMQIESTNSSDTIAIAKMKSLKSELSKQSFEFSKANMTNPVGKFTFITFGSVLSNDQVLELIKASDNEFQNSPSIKALSQHLSQKAPKIGDHFSDVKVMGLDNKDANLSQYVGKSKLVLVDFWASWCGPCMHEMSNIININKKYKSKGLQIVSISMDTDKKAWAQTIKNKKMTWTQLLDINHEAAKAYQIMAIPYTMLLDAKGNIIATNLRGTELDIKIAESLK